MKSENSERIIEIEMCNHCGKFVYFGSGNYVNRVPDCNDFVTRVENNLKYPLGDYVCYNCDSKTENNNLGYTLEMLIKDQMKN
jgi:hypothetical protein